MRFWLADFVRFPSLLPSDPGSGDERISLTLPTTFVRHVAGIYTALGTLAVISVLFERRNLSKIR
jgi:hypothetical protein